MPCCARRGRPDAARPRGGQGCFERLPIPGFAMGKTCPFPKGEGVDGVHRQRETLSQTALLQYTRGEGSMAFMGSGRPLTMASDKLSWRVAHMDRARPAGDAQGGGWALSERPNDVR